VLGGGLVQAGVIVVKLGESRTARVDAAREPALAPVG